jgi:hypothetical protein
VFPVVTCDVQFLRSGEAAEVLRDYLATFEIYGAIKLRHPIRHSPHADLQEGFYGLVGTASEKGSSGPYGTAGPRRIGLMLSLSFEGTVVNLWPGCGEFAPGLMDDRFREVLLFGPSR